MQSIADKYNVNIAEVVMSWVLQEGAVCIPRSSKEEHLHMNANMQTIDANTGKLLNARIFLTEEDMQVIRDLDGSLGSLWD